MLLAFSTSAVGIGEEGETGELAFIGDEGVSLLSPVFVSKMSRVPISRGKMP